ncbi:hypothetical protein [Microcoleus sp.]|uniref:hypothetical protein n=1 Tax=Microcoleus sp. TaxID=44472 RepID=UPI003593193A
MTNLILLVFPAIGHGGSCHTCSIETSTIHGSAVRNSGNADADAAKRAARVLNLPSGVPQDEWSI